MNLALQVGSRSKLPHIPSTPGVSEPVLSRTASVAASSHPRSPRSLYNRWNRLCGLLVAAVARPHWRARAALPTLTGMGPFVAEGTDFTHLILSLLLFHGQYSLAPWFRIQTEELGSFPNKMGQLLAALSGTMTPANQTHQIRHSYPIRQKIWRQVGLGLTFRTEHYYGQV